MLATTAAVAVVIHAVAPELGWPLAFALGAIVSPPDAVAATALLRRLGVPRRVVTLLEGESLFNDATALVTYQAALAAVATAAFSPSGRRRLRGGRSGGIAIGVVVGVAIARLRADSANRGRDHDLAADAMAAYLPAEHLNVSGVLATVAAGLCLGWCAPRIMDRRRVSVPAPSGTW